MATKIAVGDGARAVYDDRWLPLLEAMGQVQIDRATDVEWQSGQWIATELSTGNVISSGRNRADCIKTEVSYLESRL